VPRTVANAAILIVTRLVTIRYPNGDHRLPATSPAGTQNVTSCHHVNKDAVQTLTLFLAYLMLKRRAIVRHSSRCGSWSLPTGTTFPLQKSMSAA